jgi:endonuclease/exonuclease/phosphatase family metal-dependent hydrolase
VFATTWNVGNAAPPRDLSAWIPCGAYDIYCIGAQECKYTPGPDFNSPRDDWIASLMRHLGSGYRLVKYNSLWEVRLAVFVANEHNHRVTNVTSDSVATGVAGVMGNKGGVVVALDVDHSRVCVVNAHLAAHQDKSSARNHNVWEIVRVAKVGRQSAGGHIDLMSQFDHVLFMGDFNYRVIIPQADGSEDLSRTPSESVFHKMTEMIAQHKIDRLLAKDQLTFEKKEQKVFVGLQEQAIKFKPTFKVKRQQQTEYLPQRAPAWCDRVLFGSAKSLSPLEPLDYWSADTIATSDHKPVCASFKLYPSMCSAGHAPGFGVVTMRFCKLAALNLQTVEARREMKRLALKENSLESSEGTKATLMQGLRAASDAARKITSGTTNPFVRVMCSAFAQDHLTRHLDNTTNPVWIQDRETINLQFNCPTRLQDCVFYFQVFSKNVSATPLLGSAMVHWGMLELVDRARAEGLPPSSTLQQKAQTSRGQEVELQFSCILTYSGLTAGALKGVVRLNWTQWVDRA